MSVLDNCAVLDRVPGDSAGPHALFPVPRSMTPPTTPDFSLLDALARRLMTGDAQAMGELYDRLAGALHALALARCGDAAEAERVVEAVLRELWYGRATLSDGAARWLPRLLVRCHQLATPDRLPGLPR